MNYEKVLLEMLERIAELEERVNLIESNRKPQGQNEAIEYKESKKYRYLSDYLSNTGKHTVTMTFSEIEDILEFDLPESARKHQEFWANSTSHSIALSWLSVNYRTVKIDLENENIVFEKNNSTNPYTPFWCGFNEYAKEDGRLLQYFKKLYGVTYEGRYELKIAPNLTQISFVKFVKENAITIEFYTRSKDLFDAIMLDKAQIESELNLPLQWKRIDGKLATRIYYKKFFFDDDSTKDMYDWLIDNAIRFKKIFSRYLPGE